MRLADLAVFPAAFGTAYVLTMLLRRYALAHSIVDIPNERSSHLAPTPRGGGIAIVLAFICGLPLLIEAGLLTGSVAVGLAGSGALASSVGFMDDRSGIDVRWRLLAHFVSAAWVLAWLGGAPDVPIFGYQLRLGPFGFVLFAIYLVWMLNLYNFMDGIDGIAGVEATTVCLGAALICWLVAPDNAGLAAPALLCCSVLGFLIWNWPPAKIFMGDAGSGFLGLVLGALSIEAASKAPNLFWTWVILLGVFIVDATVTLFRRVYRRETFYVAHRSHAYQYASRKVGSHARVTMGVGLINLVWLLPLALFVGLGQLDGVIGVCIAYTPLVWLAYRFRAGARELQDI